MSTARHQLAGAPGTGTTIDNMASRVKAWMNVAQTPATPAVRQSFNASSYNDISAGLGGVMTTAPFINAGYVALAAGWAQFGWAGRETGGRPNTAAEFQAYCVETASATPTDSEQVNMAAMGTLA